MKMDKRADGTIGHPYSALNLRLVLATFGLVSFTVLAVGLWWIGLRVIAVLAAAVAVTAVIDLVVIRRRRAERRRRDPTAHHSLFE